MAGSIAGFYLFLACMFASTLAQTDPFLAGLATKDKYCAVNINHTACKYVGGTSGGCGPAVTKRGLTAAEKTALLDAHNARRRTVANGLQVGQPPASNMAQLVWNEEAASIAQLWADQCQFAHDMNRQTVKTGTTVYNGQNFYMAWGFAVLNPTTAVDSWFKEVTLFTNPAAVGSYVIDSKTGHYSQLVWATTTSVGCGYSLKDGKHLLVCNYTPGGNIKAQPMYQIGTSCSACPTGLTKCNDGLCFAA